MVTKIETTLDAIVSVLREGGLQADWHVIPDFDGFAPVNAQPAGPVYQIQAQLGESRVEGYEAHGLLTIFDPANYPNMAHIQAIELSQDGNQFAEHLPTFTTEIDKNFSTKFLRVLHSALNVLDPTGNDKSLLVQSYNSHMTWANFLNSARYTYDFVLSFESDGQLAQIATDFHDPSIKLIVDLVRPVMRWRKMHYFARTSEISDIQIPVLLANGQIHRMANQSRALDEGMSIAKSYMDKHYARIPD